MADTASSPATTFTGRIGEAVIRFRWPIILLNVVLLAAVLAGMAGRGKEFGEFVSYMQEIRNNPQAIVPDRVAPPPIFNADYHIWFDKDNPDLVAFDKFQRVFAKEELAMIAVMARNGDVFTNENLSALRKLTDRLWSVPYVNRVDGLVNFNYTTADGDDLSVEDFISRLPMESEEMARKKETALADPLLSKFLISKDARMTQISLRVIAPPDFPQAHLEVKAKLDSLVAEAIAGNPNLEFKLGGTVVMTDAFNEFAQKDSQTLVPLMFLFIVLVLTLLLRSFWGTLLPMGLLVTSILFPVCLFVGVFGYSLNNASVNVMQILVSVAIADSVHLLTLFFQGLRQGMGRNQAIVYSVEKNFIPCLVTSLTTGVGFYSLLLQGIPPFRDLGLFAGTGSIYAFFSTVFTLPAIMSLIPFRIKSPKAETGGRSALPQWPYAWVEVVDRHKRAIVLATLVITVASVGLFFRLEIDSNAVKYFSPKTEFRQATEYIDDNIIGTNPMEFGFDAGEPGGVYSPAFLKKMERFQEHILSRPDYKFTHASSLVDVVKRLNQTMHGGDPAEYRIPEGDSITAEGDTLYARNLIAQYVLLYTLSLPQGMDLTNQVNIDNSMARITAFQQSMTSSRQADIAGEINAWIDREMPEAGARALGVPIMFSNMMNLAMPGMMKGMLTSLLLITITLVITLRSLRAGLLSLIPNVWPIVVMYGLIGLSGYMVNLSVAVVGMITLGIAVDDTVHFMAHYLHGVRAGMSRKEAIVRTYQTTGTAILFTSIILIAGFLVLTLSLFSLNVDLGMFCSLVWALALLAEFTVLPAVILMFDKSRPEEKGNDMANRERAGVTA